jgi:hypothetical protein
LVIIDPSPPRENKEKNFPKIFSPEICDKKVAKFSSNKKKYKVFGYLLINEGYYKLW